MRFFGKKKEEEPETLPAKAVIKDLTPHNKRRRKEPPKPWGKLERILIILLLGGTTLVSGFLALKARAWRLPGMPRVEISGLTTGGTIVLEKKDKPRDSTDEIVSQFEAATAELSGVYGFSVIRLDDGRYGLYEDEVFTAASLIKLPVIIALYKEAEAGNIDLDDEYAITQNDKSPGSGSLYGRPVGSIVTIRELARYMGKESDNTAFRAARSLLGDAKINEVIEELGMTQTSLAENDTSPADIAALFENLWDGNIVSIDYRDEILSFLTDTIYEDRIPAGLPSDVEVAHKIGTEVGAISDAGIVFASRPYIVVLMSKGVIETEAKEVLPTLSQLIYEFEESQ